MKTLDFALAALMAVATPAALPAQEAVDASPTTETAERPLFVDSKSIEDFLWVARPVIVFADSPNDPRFIQQMDLLRARPEDLRRRDVVVMTDTDPDARSDVRQRLRPRGFMLAILGKDGQVELRKPRPWDVREITRTIDKMPLRQQEIRDAKRPAGEG